MIAAKGKEIRCEKASYHPGARLVHNCLKQIPENSQNSIHHPTKTPISHPSPHLLKSPLTAPRSRGVAALPSAALNVTAAKRSGGASGFSVQIARRVRSCSTSWASRAEQGQRRKGEILFKYTNIVQYVYIIIMCMRIKYIVCVYCTVYIYTYKYSMYIYICIYSIHKGGADS